MVTNSPSLFEKKSFVQFSLNAIPYGLLILSVVVSTLLCKFPPGGVFALNIKALSMEGRISMI
jgi:hypothetical protein